MGRIDAPPPRIEPLARRWRPADRGRPLAAPRESAAGEDVRSFVRGRYAIFTASLRSAVEKLVTNFHLPANVSCGQRAEGLGLMQEATPCHEKGYVSTHYGDASLLLSAWRSKLDLSSTDGSGSSPTRTPLHRLVAAPSQGGPQISNISAPPSPSET